MAPGFAHSTRTGAVMAAFAAVAACEVLAIPRAVRRIVQAWLLGLAALLTVAL